MNISPEQLDFIQAGLVPMSVVACAGSGKTTTAIQRIAQMRRQLGEYRGRVALLSFSNVAVETFRKGYQALLQDRSIGPARSRVEIDTLDGFITGNVLRPHAHRTMGSKQAPFLVTGGEAFLSGFKIPANRYPREITDLQVGFENGAIYFCYSDPNQIHRLDTASACRLVQRLGTTGAYTHNLGRYWCYRTLMEQPGILRALTRRYPHILIDEAQDIGSVHEAIVEQLIGTGCQVSLIGDPNQGIFEFAGADGAFLRHYGERDGVLSRGLTRNFRSVPPILDLANTLSGRADTADRATPETLHGAFFVPYRSVEREQVIAAFQEAILAAGLKIERSAVLCRGREMANRLSGNEGAPGQGIVKQLAKAAILRDKHADYLGAFKCVVTAVVSLLAKPPHGLVARLTQPARYPEVRSLRRLLWTFTRDPTKGLPAAALIADTQWHPGMLEKTKNLLAAIAREHSLPSGDNLGNKLARKGLPHVSLVPPGDLAAGSPTRIRVDTVHQFKGESLDAVLYLTAKEHAAALLAGVQSEEGRIGYVAVTRARNLLWLAVPANALADLRPALLARGFKPVSAGN